MSNSISKIIKNFSFLLISSICSKIILASITIYLARILGPKGFGIIGFSQAFVIYFTLMTDLGLKTLALREIANNQNKKLLIDTIFTSRLILTIIAFSIFSTVIYIFPFEPATKPVLTLYGFLIFLNGLFVDWIFMSHEKMEFVAGAELFKDLIYCVLIFLLVTQNDQILKIPIAYLIAMSLALIGLFYFLTRLNLAPKINWKAFDIWYMLKLALPLGATQIFITLYYYSDQVILGFIKSKEVVGFYSAPYKLINLGALVLNLFINSVIPFLTRTYNRDRALYNKLINFSSKICLFIFFPVGLLLWSFSQEIILILFGSSYLNSVVLLKLLIWAFVIMGIRFLFENYLIISGSQKTYMKYAFFYFLSNMILNLLLIPWLGAKGAAIATVFSDIFFITILYFVLPGEFFIGYKIIFILIFCITFITLSLIEIIKGTTIFYLLGAFAAFTLVFLWYFLKNKNEIKSLFLKIKKLISA